MSYKKHMNEKKQFLNEAKEYLIEIYDSLKQGASQKKLLGEIRYIIDIINFTKQLVPYSIYAKYDDFFEAFSVFITTCKDEAFLEEHEEDMVSSSELMVECYEELIREYVRKVKVCACCGNEVLYAPIVPMVKNDDKVYEYLTGPNWNETLNKWEYYCPRCMSTDRDRMIISFMQLSKLNNAPEKTRVLQFAPASSIECWIKDNCPQVDYESTDLFMDGVSFKSDIQNMSMVEDETYDFIICSHVLEHVKDDLLAMQEMKRILKKDGMIAFLVPVSLDVNEIDEEWGCPEEENIRRFGQKDHCRRYSKNGLIERLNRYFQVYQLGKEFFGENVFSQCGLTETSTLYVLTKDSVSSFEFKNQVAVDEKIYTEGPLVSVVMSCYNHEAFVEEAILSVLNQTYRNIEFLVADDASSDHSVEVMKKYSKYYSYEEYFENNKGGRLGELIDRAKGKYIAQMNSDDVWEPEKIAIQVDYLEKHPECGVCFTWCEYVNENLEPIKDNIFLKKNRSRYEWMKYFWYNGNALCDPSALMTKENKKWVASFGTICWQLPDFYRWVDMIQHMDFYIVPQKLVKMRRYNKVGVKPVSHSNMENKVRHIIEEGAVWPSVISHMDEDFFTKTFSDVMKNKEAHTTIEIKCEKYFLLTCHHNVFVQNSAFQYLTQEFNEIRECLEKQYGYTKKNIKEDIVKIGIAPSMMRGGEE